MILYLSLLLKFYYIIKPFFPDCLQYIIRKKYIKFQRKFLIKNWPIDFASGAKPENWNGWPEGKKFTLLLTHDVEDQEGHDNCHKMVELEIGLGFRSAFNFIPEKYRVSSELRQNLVDQGFEVGVHGLYHDGKLYFNHRIFSKRAKKINKYLKQWKSVGFRSPAMHHNLEWLHELDIQYDLSTFDTDPFEPQSNGARTIFPFCVDGGEVNKRFVELPYTLPQDSTLFIFLEEKNIDIWKKKVDWIAKQGGMVLLNTHPDYIDFDHKKWCNKKYPSRFYEEFLRWIKEKYSDQYWHALPRELAETYMKNYCKGKI